MGTYTTPDHSHVLKVAVLGDCGVGKTCLARRWAGEKVFVEESEVQPPTVGVDFRARVVVDKGREDGRKFQLLIRDLSGDRRFRTLSRPLFRDTHAAILVYDVTDADSFLNVAEWINSGEIKDTQVRVLLGNKDDSPTRMVDWAEGKKLCVDRGLDHFAEVSAKTGHNVDNVLEWLAANASMSKSEMALMEEHQILKKRKYPSLGCCLIS